MKIILDMGTACVKLCRMMHSYITFTTFTTKFYVHQASSVGSPQPVDVPAKTKTTQFLCLVSSLY